MKHVTTRLLLPILMFCASLALTFGLPTTSAHAQITLNVNSVADDPDDNIGDEICQTSSGECTLRAALQEVSAEDIQDRWVIEFDQIPTATENGRQVARIETGSELDLNGSNVQVRGDTAPGWQAGDPPIVYIDGSNIDPGIRQFATTDGLELRPDADTVSVIGLGVVGFPDDGINLIGSGSSLSTGRPFHVAIQYCWIGIEPDGTANGNGFDSASTDQGAGIDIANPRNVTIGASGVSGFSSDPIPNTAVIYADGGENVIGGNAEMGINLFSSDNVNRPLREGNVVIANNYIGLLPDGTTPRGNGTFGIKIENTRESYIGYVNSSQERFPNYIAGNGSGGIFIDSETIDVVANVLGTTADASSTSSALAPGQDGILLQNPTTVGVNVIGDIAGDGIVDQYNIIGGYVYGIRAGTDDNSNTSGAEADYEFIRENYFGVSPNGDAIPLQSAGIYAQFADSLRISGNRFGNIGSGGTEDAAISIPQSEIGNHQIENNLIGVLDDVSTHPIDGDGIYHGPSGLSDNFIQDNIIGNTTRNGIHVFGMTRANSGPFITGNSIGFTRAGTDIGNGDAGVRFSNSVSGVVGSSIFNRDDPDTEGNLIGFNSGPGVAVTGTDSRVAIRGNQFRNNGGLMIDLGDDGVTANDPANGDADTGPNKLMNTPEVVSFECQTGLSQDNLTVTYRVRTSSGNANFDPSNGLLIDLYAGSTPNNIDSYLETDTYLNGFTKQTVTASAVNLCDQYFFLMTTDDVDFSTPRESASTSEFFNPAPQLPVELAMFDVLPTGDRGAELVWETLQEKNNDRFEIEHLAPEASEWINAGTKRGAGTTTERQRYTFSLSDLEVGTHAFRLRQVDVDGTEELLEEKSVRIQLDVAYELRVGPNPMRSTANGALTLRDAQTVRAVVYDVLGREVARVHDGAMEAGKNTFSIDASRLGSGRYFLRVTGESFRDTQPFTVVR